jgi:hypothetical protein
MGKPEHALTLGNPLDWLGQRPLTFGKPSWMVGTESPNGGEPSWLVGTESPNGGETILTGWDQRALTLESVLMQFPCNNYLISGSPPIFLPTAYSLSLVGLLVYFLKAFRGTIRRFTLWTKINIKKPMKFGLIFHVIQTAFSCRYFYIQVFLKWTKCKLTKCNFISIIIWIKSFFQ